MRTAFPGFIALSLFLVHCSDEPEDSGNTGGAGTGGGAGAMTGGSAGASTGGTSTGGTSTGGTSTGGTSTGGTSTGGTSGTAGASSGTGGAGGAASGAGGASAGAGGANAGAGGMAMGGAGGAGGGMGGKAGGGGQAGAGGGGALMLTSSAITEGGMIPDAHTCAGANTSPPLTWTAGPSGTMSYAISLVDMSNGIEHWVIWDIPASVTMIDNVPNGANPTMPSGAKQRGFASRPNGYFGPCPNMQLHTYVFTVYALNVATLPGVTTNTMLEPLIEAIVDANPLASDTLSGQSDAAM